ncbi:MAG TPA: hypothetical protein VKV17_17770 [Bryobacteraceae bacterium]|nr:hypothetical protein [Bryobacteraceae bacterium]
MAGRRPEGAGGGVRPDVPEQAGFFDAGTERQSPVDAQRGADRLLGDQLAAQLKSGLAAKPTKLKPAQNRGLFSDAGPEPGDLFGQMSRTMHGGVPLDVVGAIFKADLKEMLALKQKRDESLAALEKAKETPEEKRFGQKVIPYFTGERDMWSARVNQAMARLRKLVPDPIEQEALSPMRDFKADD